MSASHCPTPAVFVAISTSSDPGTGTGREWIERAPGPPNASSAAARMISGSSRAVFVVFARLMRLLPHAQSLRGGRQPQRAVQQRHQLHESAFRLLRVVHLAAGNHPSVPRSVVRFALVRAV